MKDRIKLAGIAMGASVLVWAAAGCEPPADVATGEEEVAVGQLSSALVQALPESMRSTPLDSAVVRGLVADERYAEARELVEARLASDPSDMDAALMLTGIDLLDEQYEVAREVASQWLAEAPQELRLLERRALASLLAHDVDAAEADYEDVLRALASAGGDELCEPMVECCFPASVRRAMAKVGLATARFNQGRLDEAESLAHALIDEARRDPHLDPAAGQFVLALTASKKGDLDRSRALYEAIVARYPDSAAALNNLGGVHYDLGDLDRALSYYLAAYEHAGSDRRGAAIAWINAAEVSMLRGDYADAEDKLLEAVDMSPGYAGGYFELAVLHDLMGNRRAAEAHMATGLELDGSGVVRWNASFFTPEWKAQFEALVAEASGDADAARALWTAVREGGVPALHASAARHLASLSTATRALTFFNP